VIDAGTKLPAVDRSFEDGSLIGSRHKRISEALCFPERPIEWKNSVCPANGRFLMLASLRRAILSLWIVRNRSSEFGESLTEITEYQRDCIDWQSNRAPKL
jgi:hypothetical protein